ncbi:hypothetical protein yc1106_01147 [Curvularia clavata]|uniref:Zn(2)-C6 fungal-type domain-containing protein n=1 Tax=Curvularia clavata TaxID=95742 RepID=A0A9Q8Z3W2_CURCL|nr:hypothetical protein yc1106_01147 [Curvularia clavata]
MPAQSQAKRQSALLLEEKPAKRTRVSRACDQCRVAREKCDGHQPTCSTCSGTTRICSYTANPKKRGIQPGYIRTLELALAWLFQHNPENESALKEKLAEEGASSLLLSRDSKESNKLHRRWRKSKFYVDVDKHLSGGEPSRHEQTDTIGPPSSDEDSDTEEPSNNKASRSQGSNVQPQRIESPGLVQTASTPRRQPGSIHTPETIPHDSWKLFEVYFANVHSWLPICEKHDTLKSAYAYPLQNHSIEHEQADSGAHAELWSVLAVASLYDANRNNSMDSPSTRPTKLYETARSMIPNENIHFNIGHIRALLNLVVFNMSRMLTGSAWLLAGYASRALENLDQPALVACSRYKHVYYGCLLLDGILAFQLNRRPHFRKSDLEQLGPIDEDGLEEWQPWSGFNDPAYVGRMTPLLSLSTFNNLIELVDILVSTEQRWSRLLYQEDSVRRLERWKSSLPAKLGTSFSAKSSSLLAPPAALLQATYLCACFISNPSDFGLQQLLDVLEQCQSDIGIQRLPIPTQSLISTISRLASQLNLPDATAMRLQRVQTGIVAVWSQPNNQDASPNPESAIITARNSSTGINLSTPESLQMVTPDSHATAHPAIDPLNDFFPGSYATNASHPAVPSPSQTDPRYPEHTSDLETFFDELASLDNATRLDNQPQFMQNLGFGPGASMADLFSEYIPLQSSNFLTRDEGVPTNLDQYTFYDAS